MSRVSFRWVTYVDTPTEQVDQEMCAALCRHAHGRSIKWETAVITRYPSYDPDLEAVAIGAELGDRAPRAQVLRS